MCQQPLVQLLLDLDTLWRANMNMRLVARTLYFIFYITFVYVATTVLHYVGSGWIRKKKIHQRLHADSGEKKNG